MQKASIMLGFSRLSEDRFGTLSRFEAFLRVAFGVHAGAWLVGSWATRAGWLPVAATWLLKVENVAKMVSCENGRF